MPEWGVPMAASLTTFPLIGVYDQLLDKPNIHLAVQAAVPILIGTIFYGTAGLFVGLIINQRPRFSLCALMIGMYWR